MRTIYKLPKDLTEIEDVYVGKPGCRCGCRGNYYKDEAHIARVCRKIIKHRNLGIQVIKNGRKRIFTCLIGKTEYSIYEKRRL
jgi:hypothetical protein